MNVIPNEVLAWPVATSHSSLQKY